MNEKRGARRLLLLLAPLHACASTPAPQAQNSSTNEAVARAPATDRNTFDRGAAAHALAGPDTSRCAEPGGPRGAGHLTIAFAEDGSVVSTNVDAAPFAGTPTGWCVEELFKTIRVPPFESESPLKSIKIGKSFMIR